MNDAPIEGNITGGSSDSIFVQADNGREYEVPRDDVSSIDYPGNVHANVGVGLLAYGALNIAVGFPKCNERHDDQKTAVCTGVFLPAVLGAGLITWGLIVHHGQTAAVADVSRASSLPKPQPKRWEDFPRPRRDAPATPSATPVEHAPVAPSNSVEPPTSTPPSTQ